VSLYRSGTRVLGDLTDLDSFARLPWTSGYVQGIIDAPYLTLTPGTRLGVIHDAALARLADELAPLEKRLAKIIEDQQRAEEEQKTRTDRADFVSSTRSFPLALATATRVAMG